MDREVPDELLVSSLALYIILNESHLKTPPPQVHGAVYLTYSLDRNVEHLAWHYDPTYLSIDYIFDIRNEPVIVPPHASIAKSKYKQINPKHIKGPLGPNKQLFHLPFADQTSSEADSVSPLGEERGEKTLLLYFRAVVNTCPEGLYINAADKSAILCTALDQGYIRRVIPTIDLSNKKSSIKATFLIEGTDRRSEVISTMPLQSVKRQTKLLWHRDHEVATRLLEFAESPPLPPGTFSFFYGHFTHIFPTSLCRSVLDVAVPTCFEQLIELKCSAGIDWARRIYTYLTGEVFGVPANEKLTLLPLRNQRGLGLENHGNIVFMAEFFFITSETSILILTRSLRLIAHEIIHQWLGNTITPYEPSEIWLREGLVRFMEYYVTDKVLTQLNVPEAVHEYLWNTFIYEVKADAMSRDLQYSARPLQVVPCDYTHQEFLRLYDAISYNKAAVVLLMWDIFISGKQDWPFSRRSLWVSALRKLFRKVVHSQGSLFTWQMILDLGQGDIEENPPQRLPKSRFSITPTPCRYEDKRLKDLITPWLVQPSYPRVSWYWDPSSGKLVINQRVCVWPIPLHMVMIDDEGTVHIPFVLTQSQETFTISSKSSIKDVYVMDGAGGFGYFTIQNPTTNVKMIDFSTLTGRVGFSIDWHWLINATSKESVTGAIIRVLTTQDIEAGEMLNGLRNRMIPKALVKFKPIAPDASVNFAWKSTLNSF